MLRNLLHRVRTPGTPECIDSAGRLKAAVQLLFCNYTKQDATANPVLGRTFLPPKELIQAGGLPLFQKVGHVLDNLQDRYLDMDLAHLVAEPPVQAVLLKECPAGVFSEEPMVKSVQWTHGTATWLLVWCHGLCYWHNGLMARTHFTRQSFAKSLHMQNTHTLTLATQGVLLFFSEHLCARAPSSLWTHGIGACVVHLVTGKA